MSNAVITNQELREMLEYNRAKELFPNCKDPAKKGRLWTIIANYNREHSSQKTSVRQMGNDGR